jgi:membrane protein implicated in regulation of membrane protease activity
MTAGTDQDEDTPRWPSISSKLAWSTRAYLRLTGVRGWIVTNRWPTAVTVATVVAGMAMFVVSAELDGRHPWLASLWADLGSNVVVFAPLLVLTTVFGWRAARSQTRLEQAQRRVERRTTNLEERVESALEKISQESVDLLARDRVDDESLIDAVQTNPTPQGVARALWLGQNMGFTSVLGPRVSIFDADVFVRLVVEPPFGGEVIVVLESRDGDEIERIVWRRPEGAPSLGARIGRILRRIGRYPGDIAYQPGSIFEELHRLLDLGYRGATGAGGITNPVGRILQLCGDRWAVTDTCLTLVDRSYPVHLYRLNETDWDAHIRPRGPEYDIGGFRQAMDVAKAYIALGRLSTDRPRWADPLEDQPP